MLSHRRGSISLIVTVVVLVVSWSTVSISSAQYDTPRWGKIPQEHMDMVSFPDDPDAHAVILADYGEVTFNHDFAMVYKGHRRIKILSEAGYDEWGTVSLSYLKGYHRVKDFEGQTFVPTEGGKPERIKVDKKSIFTEEVAGRYHERKMTFPSLAPGVVIEYRYTIISDFSGNIPGWDFQDSEPTLWSEYVAEIPDIFAFVTALRGNIGYDIMETDNTNPNGMKSQRHRWVMRNVPAIREEPYMTTLADYSVRLTLQMSGFFDPYSGAMQMSDTWADLVNELQDDTDFGRRLDPSKMIRDIVEEATAGKSGSEKIAAVHNYVRDNVEWDGDYGMYAFSSLNRTLESGTGDSGEINLLLVSMLRAAGFEAYPMLISTRNNGSPVESYPILDQFNYVLAYVEQGSTGISLDGTRSTHPYMLLPKSTLNRRGFVIRDDFDWENINSESMTKKHLYIRGEMSEDGTVTGGVQYAAGGYAAVDARNYIEEEGISEFFTENVFDNDGVEVAEFEVKTDSLNMFVSTGEVTIDDMVVEGGDFLYMSPLTALTIEENPFKSESRSYPVDFNYPIDNTYTLEVRLPETYEVVEAPARKMFRGGSDKARYSRVVDVQPGGLRIVCRFQINETFFSTHDYDNLRQFFEDIVASEQDQIVLKSTASE